LRAYISPQQQKVEENKGMAFNDAEVQEFIALWKRVSGGKELSEEEAQEHAEALINFLSLLHRMDS